MIANTYFLAMIIYFIHAVLVYFHCEILHFSYPVVLGSVSVALNLLDDASMCVIMNAVSCWYSLMTLV
jgi:hypothetical protein